jgi:large subunit ribosomal protein L27
MAHKKAGSSSKNGRDSVGQRLGVKRGDGAQVSSGTIIVRQRGSTFHPGANVGMARDYTLFATADGTVKFTHQSRSRKQVSVVTA